MESPKKTVSPALIGLIAIVVLTGSGIAVSRYLSSTTSATSNTSNTSSTSLITPSVSASSTVSSASNYKDGTYSANASYQTPRSNETIAVTVTVKSGVVTDVTIDQNPGDRDSAEYQSMFASEYKSEVVGKPMDSLNLSRVAGASLTTNGFNDALDQIRSQAKG